MHKYRSGFCPFFQTDISHLMYVSRYDIKRFDASKYKRKVDVSMTDKKIR